MTNRKYKMYYDYRKRTSGGFLDAIFLYLLTSISISLGSNGLSNFNAKNEKK